MRYALFMHQNKRVKVGDRFGSVVVLDRERRGKSNAKVLCDCGAEFNAYTYLLESGKTFRCKGCTDIARKGVPLLANRIDPLQRTINDLWNSFRKSMRAKPGSNLTKDEWFEIVLSVCVYCGTPPSNRKKAVVEHAQDFWYNGIDRVNSSLPYIVSNVQATCWPCNRMKGKMSHEDFLDHVRKVASWQTK